jgi:UDP-N-acetylglucosamine 2-epimerase (non-hydrolysing)
MQLPVIAGAPHNLMEVSAIFEAFAEPGRLHDSAVMKLVPVHSRTRKNLQEFGIFQASSGIRLVEEMGYLRFISLVSRAGLVLAGSGGIQEQNTVLGVPYLTMRHNTERPITCTLETIILLDTDPERIRHTIPPKWDGHAGARIVDRLLGIESGGAY